jgi:U4/U6 small nuclear ribonucleoprotein PRP3
MPAEKRPYPGDHGDANGSKRAKSTGPTAPPKTDFLAAAKAKAAEAAARIAAKIKEDKARADAAAGGGVSTNGALSSQPSVPPAANSKLAAMKARIAALAAQNGASPASSTNAPPVRPPPSHAASASSSRDDGKQRRSEVTGPRFATTLGNRRVDSETPAPESRTRAPAVQAEETLENPYYDPKAVPTRGSTRVARGLLFNQRGKYLDQASKLRAQGRLEQIKAVLAKQARQTGLDENSERGFLVQAPPDVEWWDEGLLDEPSYDCIDDPAKLKIDGDNSIITLYVQHPVILKAPQDQLLIQVKPMYLTTKEQAKLRRMRRAADLKEHQAKIRLGLEPPPPPKVKRGNMMRVMGEQAIADPTAVEMLVESQIAERHDTHIKANEERKLTKEERLAKLAENQEKDAKKGLHMCVFKINTLAFGKHRYQIDNNAKQLALTGITLFHPQMNLVIVEGGVHAVEKYKKLMLNRIKWTDNGRPTDIQEEKSASDPQWMKPLDGSGNLKDHSSNKCTLVFEGEIKQHAFRKWGSKMCETDGEAKEALSRNKLDSLWALARNSE